MIRDVSIKNYKSISELSLELGRVNLFIGANGCGKSNILEAIIFGSAAVAGKLDNEFLANRGIRIRDSRRVLCGFDKGNLSRPIELEFSTADDERLIMELRSKEGAYAGWVQSNPLLNEISPETMGMFYEMTMTEGPEPRGIRWITLAKRIAQEPKVEPEVRLVIELVLIYRNVGYDLMPFIVYSPLISTLRQLTNESAIEPLGRYGEGLFRLLRVLESQGRLQDVNQAIAAIDWFDGLALVGDSSTGDRHIRIIDHFLDPEFPALDHRSANEGFLFFLFHIALLISPDTPPFFAVENVDESLNPKLCVHLMQTIARLSQEHGKQVILTTHNPAVLDGLDLTDDEQRLFVIYRNADGHTRARRILHRESKVRLSEAFIRGYLGGLPNNF